MVGVFALFAEEAERRAGVVLRRPVRTRLTRRRARRVLVLTHWTVQTVLEAVGVGAAVPADVALVARLRRVARVLSAELTRDARGRVVVVCAVFARRTRRTHLRARRRRVRTGLTRRAIHRAAADKENARMRADVSVDRARRMRSTAHAPRTYPGGAYVPGPHWLGHAVWPVLGLKVPPGQLTHVPLRRPNWPGAQGSHSTRP